MVNYSLHKLAWNILDYDPYMDNINNDSIDNYKDSEFKVYLQEFTGYDLDSDLDKYKVLVTQVLLPILNAFPELESLLNKNWNNKTYLKSGIPFLKYEAVKDVINELLYNITNSTKLISLIYKSNHILKFKSEKNKLKKLAIFLIILIEASPIKVK